MLADDDERGFRDYVEMLETLSEKGIIKEKPRLAIQLLPMMDDQAIVSVTRLAVEEVAVLRSHKPDEQK